MKLPLIRQAYQNANNEQLESALVVLEAISEARGLKEEEVDFIGELITTICGAMEVREMVNGGMRESEALNAFAQKVMGSIDK
jgi:hypothetical protein